jgi:hypothetical protein
MRISKLLSIYGVVSSIVLLALFYWVVLPFAFASDSQRVGYPWDWSHEHLVFSQTSDPRVSKIIEQDARLGHQRLKRLPQSQQGITNARGPGSLSALLEILKARGVTSSGRNRSGKLEGQATAPSLLRAFQLGIVILVASAIIVLSRPRRWRPVLLTSLVSICFLAITSCSQLPGSSSIAQDPGSQNPLGQDPSAQGPSPQESPAIPGDWSAALGVTNFAAINSATAAPIYPAKYTFDPNAAPSCTTDYVVFATGAAGTNTGLSRVPSIAAFNELYTSQAGGTPAGFCGTTGPSVAWAYLNVTCATSTSASTDPISSSPVLSLDGKKVAWVTSTGKVQILTIGTVGTNGSSATNPVCIQNAPSGVATSPNNAVLNSVTLANAAHNPVSGVSLSSVFVDYNSDSAYVGDNDGYLHKITPFFTAGGALQEVTTPSWQSRHAYLVGSIIVDSNGFIEQATAAVFPFSSGATAPTWNQTWGGTTTDDRVTWTNKGSGGGWPVYVTGVSTHLDTAPLSAPVFDFVSKNIFVGDQNGSLYYVLDPGASSAVGSCANGAVLRPCVGTPGTTTGTTAAAGSQTHCAAAATCLVMSNQQGFVDPVIVDSSDNLVITQFSNADGTNAKVEQTNASLSAFHSATLAGQAARAYHIGSFDNTYFNSSPASGFYYLCGPSANGKETDLYRVGFTNTAGTIALGSTNGTPLKLTNNNKAANCSPLTEVFNTVTSTDWLFLSVDAFGVTGTCNRGSCVMSFVLGSSMVSAINASYASALLDFGGTGGFIVDNVVSTVTFPQASSIYFAPIANNLTCGDGAIISGCGFKLTQSGLQ